MMLMWNAGSSKFAMNKSGRFFYWFVHDNNLDLVCQASEYGYNYQ